jgi:hypothetical protein
VHFHLLFLDGAYRTEGVAAPVFRAVCAPRAQELQGLAEQIALRIGRTLEQCGLIGHSITYRIAVGPRTGQKLFTLQTLPGRPPELAV